jgi:hypothetical protein
MTAPMTAIETTGMVDENQQLRLDGKLPIKGPQRVRVIVLYPAEDANEISEDEWLYAAAHNPAFDFLKESSEDIYTPEDGEPFRDEV